MIGSESHSPSPYSASAAIVGANIIQMSSRRVFTGRNVVLSDGQPHAATVIADVNTGKIVEIIDRVSNRTDFPDIGDAEWMDAGDKYILPGLVE